MDPREVTGNLLKICKVVREKSFNAPTVRIRSGIGGGAKRNHFETGMLTNAYMHSDFRTSREKWSNSINRTIEIKSSEPQFTGVNLTSE